MKKFLALSLMAIFCAATLTSCDPGVLKGWKYIETRGQISIGIDDTFTPMSFEEKDEEQNINVTKGFDVDLANAVCEELDIEAKFLPLRKDNKPNDLKDQRLDIIWNGIAKTEATEDKLIFTSKYYKDKMVIVSLSDDVSIKSIADLSDYKIGIPLGSAADDIIKAHADYNSFKEKVTTYEMKSTIDPISYNLALQALKNGDVDCMIVDGIYADYYNENNNDNKFIVQEFNFGEIELELAFRNGKGEETLPEKIDEALKKVIESGKAAEISEKWLGKNIFE